MPGKDGKGPAGAGPRTSRRGGRNNSRGGGRGMRAGGECICRQCEATAPHPAGTPCIQIKCPNCGSLMARK